MFPFTPSIDPAVIALAPGFRAVSLLVDAAETLHPEIGSEALASACRAALERKCDYADAHITAWNNVFIQFGAKPKRTPTSVDALLKRVFREQGIPSVNPVVDLYNAVSIKYAVPVGGENAAAYAGNPRLVRASGDEIFDTVRQGKPVSERPEPGEVVWRDDKGVTCRRWNWRQGVRTRLDADVPHMWFILESLPEMPSDALQQAAAELAEGLTLMMPDCRIRQHLLGTAFN